MKKQKQLIAYWEESGLLQSVPVKLKNIYVKNLEIGRRYLELRNGNDRVETLIYPLIFRATNLNNDVDVFDVIDNFIFHYNHKYKDIEMRNHKEYIINLENKIEDFDKEMEALNQYFKNHFESYAKKTKKAT
jgi:hypothetical protein